MEEKKLPVMLSIRGEQYFDDVDPDETELMTEGTMTLRGENIYLSYQESELTGMEGTTTTFRIQGDTVTLTRSSGKWKVTGIKQIGIIIEPDIAEPTPIPEE